MNVSMDGLRKRMIADYNSLVRTLNANIDDKSRIKVDTSEIDLQLDGLRSAIVTLAFCYIDGEFDSLDENTHFESFNLES